MKKIISIILLISMICGLGINVSAYSGVGAESNPYVITTPEDLMNMKNDLSAHYVLGNSIDMTDVWYEPVGNDIDGAFTGSFDGRGYTISNLDLDLEGSKYVGLFGYLDGTVKNVNLTNVNANGYKYVGGICGYAKGNTLISNCSVSGSAVGTFILDEIYVGGIVGRGSYATITDCNVEGTIGSGGSAPYYSTAYAGGIAGYNSGIIENCINKAGIWQSDTRSKTEYLGGIVGVFVGNKVSRCENYGDIKCIPRSEGYGYCGGIIGYLDSTAEIYGCINYADVYSYTYNPNAGGIIGFGGGNTSISSCVNTGEITAETYTGYYSNDGFAGGIAGRMIGDTTLINSCVNTGCVNSNKRISECVAASSNLSVESCFFVGIRQYGNNSYTYAYIKGDESQNYDLEYYSDDPSNFENYSLLDFEGEWYIDEDYNSGFPYLSNIPEHLVLNESFLIIEKNKNKRLSAYWKGKETDVTWQSNSTDIISVSNGNMHALNPGVAIVSAETRDGKKANCLVYVYEKVTNIDINAEIVVEKGKKVKLDVSVLPAMANESIKWYSDNEDVATVDGSGNVTGVHSGSATITAKTAYGKIYDECLVTVVGKPITSLSLSTTSTTLNVVDTKQLSVNISPTDYQGEIVWSSSDESIATVDNTGLVTAKYPGMAYIYAQAESGVTTQCTVTVKAPATEIKLNKSELTLQKGYTEKLLPAMMPEYTTDSISWASSNSSYVSVSSDGTVTAKAVGQVIITATTTSGEKAYCTVNVVNPSVPVSSVTLDKTELIMTKADTAQLKASVLPTNATNQNLTWVSSDESVATVNSTGVVTAVDTGVAIIGATANNGVYHECVIKVISASGSSVVLSDAKASPDGTVQVKASLVKNPGISGYKFTVNYDESILTPVKVSNNSDFGGSITTNLEDNNRKGLNIVWYANEDVTVNGELFTIYFKVSDTAEYGDASSVSIEYGAKDICNTAGEYFALYIDDATISIEEPISGDIYEDGEVTIYDLTLLSRYITSLETFTERQKEAVDVNNDGLIDILDVIRLAQYLAGWSDVELMSVGLFSLCESATPVIDIGSASVNGANEAEIPVYIKGNTGIAAYRFVLDYNAEDIEILSITPSDLIDKDAFNTNLGAESQAENGLIVTSHTSGGNMTEDGVLFTIKVRYKNPVDTSVSPISIIDNFNNIGNENATYVTATYETGYALGSDYIVVNKVVGDTKFSCELYFDDSYAEQSAKAIIAFYDADGRMVQLMPKDISVKPGKVDLSIDYDKKAYATYKLMIWEGINSLKPITDVK